jgi:hypothetical protein
MIDNIWRDRERELNRRAEISRLLSDGPVVISEQKRPVVEWAMRILRYIRASLSRTGAQVPAHEPPGDMPCV